MLKKIAMTIPLFINAVAILIPEAVLAFKNRFSQKSIMIKINIEEHTMKQIHSALALVAFSAVLAGCATTEADAPKAAPAPAAAAPAPAAAPDAALTTAVMTSLAKNTELKGTKITVAATTDGAVTLSGTAINEWQQYLAGDVAKKTAGVKSVKNSVKVPD